MSYKVETFDLTKVQELIDYLPKGHINMTVRRLHHKDTVISKRQVKYVLDKIHRFRFRLNLDPLEFNMIGLKILNELIEISLENKASVDSITKLTQEQEDGE